jgi:DNA-binding NarL/FixJ family response regulator
VFDSRVHATLLKAASSSEASGGAPPGGPLPDGLTEREAEILRLIAQGLNNPEIAARLFVTSHTVKSHINRIFAKTGSRDRSAAIGYAHRHGLG